MTGAADPSDAARRAELREVADAERAICDEMVVVTSAESVVRTSRVEDLAAAQRAAWRRVTAARGQLTRARKDGGADRIAAAAQRLDDRQREAEQLADTAIDEIRPDAPGLGRPGRGHRHLPDPGDPRPGTRVRGRVGTTRNGPDPQPMITG